MTKKKPNATTGRPKQYDEEMLRAVIAEMLASGVAADDIDEKSVKPLLCETHGVSDSINTGSLAKHVETVLRAVLDEEKQALVSALPSEIGPAVDDVAARMKQDLLLLVARQNAVCHQNAERECEILRQDKANANWRIAELEGDAARMEAEITELQDDKRAREEELASAQAEIRTLQSKLSERGEESRALAMLIEELRDPGIRRDIRSVLAEIAREPETQPTQS